LVHGVSVGEVKAAQSLVRGLEEEAANGEALEVIISASTATGLKVARDLYPDHLVVRFPVDLSFIVRRFLGRLAPTSVILIELEIWPNFLREANRLGVPVAVVNGRITVESFARYCRFRSLLPQFGRITLFCAQDEVYADRFRTLSAAPTRVLTSGNLKVDGLRVGRRLPKPETLKQMGPRDGQLVLVGGSTHNPEELLLTQAWRETFPEARLVLVPRHPGRAGEIIRALSQAGEKCQRLSELRAAGQAADAGRPLVVDTIGELEEVYSLADLAFVGGSLVPHGGQNMLEPAAQGVACIYGPHVGNFSREASLLESAGASERLSAAGELGGSCARLLGDGAGREAMGAAALVAVAGERGAAGKTLSALGAAGLC
jgi:3-deoxy-D-manno-octulosonic-acid transferase